MANGQRTKWQAAFSTLNAQYLLMCLHALRSASYEKWLKFLTRRRRTEMYQKKNKFVSGLLTALLLIFGWRSWSEAQSEFQLQPITTTVLCTAALNNCAAAGLPNVNGAILYRPVGDVLGHAHVGIEITHDSSSYINFMGCSYFAQRGYPVLCADGPFGNATFSSQFAYYGLEQVVPTVASAINYLRNNVTGPKITKVVIFGHSG